MQNKEVVKVMEIKLDNARLSIQDKAQEIRKRLETERPRVEQKNIMESTGKKETSLDSSIEIADKLAKAFNRGIKFQVHEQTEEIYVEIIDKDTGEVIKQIPPEEMLRIAASVQEFLGLILDEKA